VLFVADILPTAYEVGVLKGRVRPATRLRSSAPLISWRRSDREAAYPARSSSTSTTATREGARVRADVVINNGNEAALARDGTDRRLGATSRSRRSVADTFELCTELIRPGGSRTSASTERA
jgi:alcohol dehydrogenase